VAEQHGIVQVKIEFPVKETFGFEERKGKKKILVMIPKEGRCHQAKRRCVLAFLMMAISPTEAFQRIPKIR
jgi:hypothetical protein